MTDQDRAFGPPPLGVTSSTAIYGFGAALLYLATRFVIPLIAKRTAVEPVVAWFIAAGLGVFLPLILVGSFLLMLEHRKDSVCLSRRLWLRRMSRTDWRRVLVGVGLIVVLSAPLVAALTHIYGKSGFTPAFLTFKPLTPDRLWILGAWVPFFALNMLGEAFIWHAVMLPRQVRSFAEHAWVISGLGWAVFHLALPWQILASLAPTIFVIPYLVQRTANVWVAVVLHVFVNGPGFLAVAFGLV